MTGTNINDVSYIQGEIQEAERRIEAEVQRIAGLAEFQQLTVIVDITTKRKLNARETVERVDVRILSLIHI
jgi:hypothetical protein